MQELLYGMPYKYLCMAKDARIERLEKEQKEAVKRSQEEEKKSIRNRITGSR